MKENMMINMNEEEARTVDGGARWYRCPWGDYGGTNFWRVYGHSIVCGYKHGYFNIPKWLIKAGISLR